MVSSTVTSSTATTLIENTMKNDLRSPGSKVTTPIPPNDANGTRDASSSSVVKFPKLTPVPAATDCQSTVRFPGKNMSWMVPLAYNGMYLPSRWYKEKSKVSAVLARYTLTAEMFMLSVPLFSTEKNSPLVYTSSFVTSVRVETRTLS
jgi:hypothetical protein